MYLQHIHLGICQCLQEGSWVNEEPYEVKGVNIGNSAILSEAPRKGRHNRAQQVKILINLNLIYLKRCCQAGPY